MSSLFDELVVASAVVDPSRPAIEQLRAAAQRDLRASIIESIPGPLWMDLCAEGACSTSELAGIFERENHREPLKELVPLLDRATIFAIASRTPTRREFASSDRGVLFQSAMRLAQVGAVDDAIALTLRFEWLTENTHLLLALCELADPSRARPLIERAMALAATESASSVTRDLCAMVAYVDDPALRDELLSLCERRVLHTKPEQMDVGENAWGWLALAYARLRRLDDVQRCLAQATIRVRDEGCDRLSDARFAVECALALDATTHEAARIALAQRAMIAMREHPREAWEWLVESVSKLDPSLETEARAMLPRDSEPPHEDGEEHTPLAPLSPIEDAKQCAADARARWTTRTLLAIRKAIASMTQARTRDEPDEQQRAPAKAARAQAFARTAYARWMSSEFDRATKGWVATLEGEALTFEIQCRVLEFLSHEEIEALLEHACPERSRRSNLLYLVAQAARGCARKGELAAMRAHVETIENYSTTPALVFELCALLPEALPKDELRRAFATARVTSDGPLSQSYRLSGLMTEAAFASAELRAIAIEAVDQIEAPMIALECLGRLLRCGEHPREDDAQCVERAKTLASRAFDQSVARVALTDDLARALCVLEDEPARAAWMKCIHMAPPSVSWELALRVFGRALIEQFAREMGGDAALTPTELDRW